METSGAESADQEAIDKAKLIVDAALDLKGERVVALDMRALSAFADTFVIVSGRSDRHVRSIADSIVRALRDQGDPPLGVEGADEGHWVLIDANDAIVHIFEPETREAFDLERLWSDATSLDLVPESTKEFED
ncbi:MAG: ribosome silencing factor [Myxococcota bacterium]|nr:ribosome silencing factor [Myxococcota bacterium]